jgi:PAS domain S-box-containing protein
MAANPHRPHWPALPNWLTLGNRSTIALVIVMFLGVFALRERDASQLNADEILFVLPIALASVRFGVRGGTAAASLAIALIVTWDTQDPDATLGVWAYLIRAIAFLTLGVLLGAFVDRRRRLEAQLSHYFDQSLDMLATANMSGWFTRVNPAWERTLGHSAQEMLSRPFIDFVHPDDREATNAETIALTGGSHQTIRFRNRYRAADGNYRWLEWSAAASPAEEAIHAVARDVTAQHEAEQQLADNAKWLETKVAERTSDLEAARAETLQRLALASEYRDDDTSQHTARVGANAAHIAERLGLGAEQVEIVGEAAPLHDVGKLAIPDSILLKPGRLTAEEYELMKTHTELGARLLSGSSSPVLQAGALIARSHHERWDGQGYPAGLTGEEIPLEGRIVAVADVFDALTHDRPYKSAWPLEQALAEIRRASGSQFDPAVVLAFLAAHEEISADLRARAPQKPRSSRRSRRRPHGGRRAGARA